MSFFLFKKAKTLVDFGIGLKDFGLLALAAVLLVLSMPPCNLSFLAFFVLVPFILALKGKGGAVAFRCGFIFGLIAYAGCAWWFFGIFRWFGVLLWAILALFPGVFAVVHSLLQNRLSRWTAIAVSPVVWTAIDFFRSEQWWLEFGWFSLGYSQHNNPLILSLAAWIGVYGVTFVATLAAAVILLLFIERSTRTVVFVAVSVVAVVVASISASALQEPAEEGSGRIRFRLVQVENDFDKCLEIASSRPLAGDSVIVLPEYALKEDPLEKQAVRERIAAVARKMNSYLMLGCIENTRDENGRHSFNNVVLLFSPDGVLHGRYQKHHPIQFFMDGKPGTGYPVMEMPLGTLGTGICYDMTYEDVARNLAARGGQVLVAPTMDVRHWGETQHIQHAMMVPFRAVETGLYLVRPASSGITMVVAPNGEILRELGINREGLLDVEVPLSDRKSFYVRLGYLFPYACQAAVVALLLLGVIRWLRRRSRHSQ